MKHLVRHAVLAGAIGLLPLVSHAESSAWAELTGLRFEVTDLAPADGIAPSFSWVNAATFVRVQTFTPPTFVSETWTPGFLSPSVKDGAAFPDLGPTRSAFAEVTPDSLIARSASSILWAAEAAAGSVASHERFEENLPSHLLLSPHTALTFSGMAHARAGRDPQPGATAIAGLTMQLGFAHPEWDNPNGPNVAHALITLGASMQTFGERSQPLSLTLLNDSAEWRDVYVWAVAGTYASAAPVPEPAAGSLLLVGLAIVARLRRRGAGLTGGAP